MTSDPRLRRHRTERGHAAARSRVGTAASFLAGLAVAACTVAPGPSPMPSAGSGFPSSAPASPVLPSVSSPSAEPTPGPSAEPTAGDLPVIDPADLFSPEVTCGDGTRFPARLLAAPEGSLGTDAAAGLFRAFLAGPDRVAANLPAIGWIRVDVPPAAVLFITASDTGWLEVGLERQAGAWTVDRYGSCALGPVLPDGVGPARWWLDPAAPAPSPQATEIAGILMEIDCASGRSPEGRIVGPAIIQRPGRILVMFAVRHRPGSQDCQGNPRFAFRFALPTPLGSRRLFDGGQIPAREAAVPNP